MQPLEGVRVLDLSIMYAGPGTTMYLGDMGADVIKIEQLSGDDSRMLGSTPYLGRNSRFFMAVNRNKRALALDLRQSAGLEIVHRLARNCDVLLHNFRPGVAERLGVDYATLRTLNDRLIYAWLTAFGSQGPYADNPAYDNVIQGYAGVYDARTRRYGDPSGAGTFVSDTTTPMLFGFAIGAALWARERTGHGQMLEGSLLGVALASQMPQWVLAAREAGANEGRTPDVLEDSCPVLQCGDGEYLTVAFITDDEWLAFCGAIERADLQRDSRFSSIEQRAQHRAELAALLEPHFQQRDRDAWLHLLTSSGVPCVPVLLRNDVKDEPHIQENGFLVEVEHPVVGRTRMFNVPLRLSETPGSVRRPAPVFAQHTDALLAELGYSAADVGRLREDGVVA